MMMIGRLAVRRRSAAARIAVVPVNVLDVLEHKVLRARHADDRFAGAHLVPQQVVRVIARAT